MNRYLYLLLCSHIVLTTSTELPVCIVGAGASGLSAAHALEALGRRTVIFDAKDTVGGNAQNYYEK
jgi:cation diffusion facilitator CzcD-associated flavoprotein CzcO